MIALSDTQHAQLVVQTKSSTGLMSFLTPWEDVAAFDMDLSLLTREGIFSKDITLRSGTVTMQVCLLHTAQC